MITSRSIILFMALFYVFSGGCNKDKNPTKSSNDMALVGIWNLTEMISESQGVTDTLTASQIDSTGLVWTFNIENDGTIEQITNISGPLITMPGTWETSAGQLSLTLTGPTGGTSTLVYEYIVNGNILELRWQLQAGASFYAEFTKQ